MGMPASRLTDMHVCPMVTGVVPHVGGPILAPGAPTVLIGKLPAARVSDQCVCVGPPDVIALGSFTVLTSKMPQARIGDLTAPVLAPARRDLTAQVDALMGPGFVTAAGTARLGDLARYLQAAELRIDKLTAHGGNIVVGCPTVLVG